MNQINREIDQARRYQYLIGLCLLVPIPSIFIYLYNGVFAGQPMGANLWMAGKAWIVIWPAIWYFWTHKNIPRPTFHSLGLWHGTYLGLIMMCSMLAVFFLVDGYMPHDDLKKKAVQLQMHQPINFILMYGYIAIINALIEEYVWRWFVTRQWEGLLRVNDKHPIKRYIPVFLSGLSFTLHHTVFLALYVPGWINLICSLGVLTGGIIWSWLLVKYKSVWPAYICHFFADVAIIIYAWRVIYN